MGVEPEWEHILYIDIDILNKLALWLIKQQNMSTGAFIEADDYIYDNKMKV